MINPHSRSNVSSYDYSFPTISISIVSHGQSQMIRPLLHDIVERQWHRLELILTINIPEDESPLLDTDFPVIFLRNDRPRGFGDNHNRAFSIASGDLFLVVNPDIRLFDFDVSFLIDSIRGYQVGVSAPRVVDRHGRVQQNARRFPTFRTMVKRVLYGEGDSDYVVDGSPRSVDWVAGMFMLFRREAFTAVNGFDDRRFFMYYEDVDICRRLRDLEWEIVFDPRTEVEHNAQRASHRSFRHAIWHLSSAIRYLTRF